MQRLLATTAILYQSKLYNPGEELPANNAVMVDAWLEAGTAVWTDDEEKKEAPKARPVTAEPGLAGVSMCSESGDEAALVGKVPKIPARKRR